MIKGSTHGCDTTTFTVPGVAPLPTDATVQRGSVQLAPVVPRPENPNNRN